MWCSNMHVNLCKEFCCWRNWFDFIYVFACGSEFRWKTLFRNHTKVGVDCAAKSKKMEHLNGMRLNYQNVLLVSLKNLNSPTIESTVNVLFINPRDLAEFSNKFYHCGTFKQWEMGASIWKLIEVNAHWNVRMAIYLMEKRN